MTLILDALDSAYGDLTDLVVSLDEAQSWRGTRCAGWAVRDLVFHLLTDAQRGLVALVTPSEHGPDRDAVTYWEDGLEVPDPEHRGVRALRSMASQWSLRFLTSTYAETATAVRTLARRTPAETVTTQNHALRVDDLLTTLVVEAAIHHLDLILDVDYPGPTPAVLAVVRSTLDGLLGRETPDNWADTDWVLVATGRMAPTREHRLALGIDADRLPILR